MEKIFYPATQRRLRTDTHIRELTSGVHLTHKSFIQPLFIEEHLQNPREVKGLHGVPVDTVNSIFNRIEHDLECGITKFLLFPIPAIKKEKDFDFTFAESLVRNIKEKFQDDIWLATDICLCSYTTHGHCGILNEDQTAVLNSQSVDILARYSTLLATAGADCIAPSDMMDGRIGAIRTQLDAFQHDQVSIMSYSAKFSSQWYGPFRDACHSTPNTPALQNRKSYQISPFHPNDALACALRDERQGADILMIKPAGLYTDIIAKLKQQTLKPIAAYHVSGEYAAIE
ncbi:MAG: porphobilinogen synthase, partial [Bacteroidota bacterium]|nr:porphobilinogen synthase [Bacteroidota bacterium]